MAEGENRNGLAIRLVIRHADRYRIWTSGTPCGSGSHGPGRVLVASDAGMRRESSYAVACRTTKAVTVFGRDIGCNRACSGHALTVKPGQLREPPVGLHCDRPDRWVLTHGQTPGKH